MAERAKILTAFIDVIFNGDQAAGGANELRRKVQGEMEAMRKAAGMAMTAMGAAITGTLGAAIASYAETGDALAKFSDRTGVSVETLSELRHATGLSGSSMEEFEKVIQRMQRTVDAAGQAIQETGEATGPANEALQRLGLTYSDLAGKKPDEQFMLIADSLSRVADPGTKAALAFEVFGRAGTKMLPMIKDGAAGIMALRQEARDLGLVITTDGARAAESWNDNWDRVKATMGGVANQLAAALIPVLDTLVAKIPPLIAQITGWIQRNPELAGAIVQVVGGVGVLMSVLGPFLLILPGIATAISGVTTALGVMAGVGGVGAAAGGGLAAASIGVSGFIALLAGTGGLIVVLGAAALAIGATIEMWRQWGIAVQERQATEAALEQTIARRIDQLRAEGVAIDEVALKEKSREEQIAYLNAQGAASREAATMRELAALTGGEATKEQIHRAELARLALNVSAKDAAVVALTDLDTETIKSLMALDAAQKESFGRWLAGERALARGNDELTAQVREHLMRLSLDHRESPSVNDLAAAAFANYLGMLGQFSTQQGGILAGLRDMWLSTWSSIVDYVSGAIASLMQAGRQALGMGGGGGVPGYAGGTQSHRGGWMDVGHGMELVQRPTRMWAPQGTRVFSAGETANILRAAGATTISVSVNVDGGAFLNDARTVDLMADRLGAKLARRLQEERRARGY